MEKIKYVDNSNGIPYGKDGHLMDNWNPNTNYGNEYVDVHFRIEAEYYKYPFTGYTEEQRNEFYKEVGEVLNAIGWSYSKDDMEIKKDKQHLYLHPQDFNGEVLKNEVRQIAEALRKNNTFYLRWVDLHSTVYDITDSEYEEYLQTRESEIRKTLFDVCQTKRRNKYCNWFDVCRGLSSKFRLKRVGLNDGKNYGSGQTIEYIGKIIDSMIEEGLLLFAEINNDKYIRSLNKTEQKSLKVNIA